VLVKYVKQVDMSIAQHATGCCG